MTTITQFAFSKEGQALFYSIFGGALITWAWGNTAHWIIRKKFKELDVNDRGWFVAAYMGALDRLLITTLTIWVQSGLGEVIAALIAVKVVLQWGDLPNATSTRPGKTRFAVSLTNNVVSITWAIMCGIWATK